MNHCSYYEFIESCYCRTGEKSAKEIRYVTNYFEKEIKCCVSFLFCLFSMYGGDKLFIYVVFDLWLLR